jgi:hypothetical protein
MVSPTLMRVLRCPTVACFLGALALAAPAAAQDIAAAEALFNRGLTDMEAGRYETGCPALAESHRFDPRAGTLFTLAECENRRGRLATAAALYGDFLSLVARLPADQRAKQRDRQQTALEQKAALKLQVPELALSLPPNAPAGTVVKRDGVVLSGPSLGLGLPVDPGEHTVSTEAPGGPITEARIKIAKGEKKQITLEVKTSAAAATAPGSTAAASPSEASTTGLEPAPDAGSNGQRVAAFAVGGVGLAGLVLGGIMGGLTLAQKDAITKGCVNKVCDHAGKIAVDRAQTTGLVSTIGFGVGLAGVGAGVVLLLTAPTRPKGAATARHGDATRLHAGVLSLGPEGGLVGLEGAW